MSDTKRVYRDGNRFYINGEFDDDMEAAVIWALRAEVEKQSNVKDGLIELYIDSNGGYAHVMVQMVELVELAKRAGVRVRTIVMGRAYSCGSMLAVTGSKGERYISRYAEHLAHYGAFDGYRKHTPLQVERMGEHFKRWTRTITDHYNRYAHIPELEDKLRDDDFWIPAGQCIEWGLADKYTEELT